MGQYETKSSGKRFRKGTPIKYVHPLFKKNTTLEVLQSIRRRTRSNNERQKLMKQIEKSKSLALQQRIQLIRYRNIARAHGPSGGRPGLWIRTALIAVVT